MKTTQILSLLILLISLFYFPSFAQQTNTGVVKATGDAHQKAMEAEQITRQVSDNVRLTSEQINMAVQNVKDITRVFEPILHLQNKWRENKQQNEPQGFDNSSSNSSAATGQDAMNNQAGNMNNGGMDNGSMNNGGMNNDGMNNNSMNNGGMDNSMPYLPLNNNYNSDGSANLGNQNSSLYGNYIDIRTGRVMDEIDAAADPTQVDIIFTATDYFNSQVPMYALLTPSFAKHDNFAYTFFHGTKYKDRNIPPRTWENVNESEIALCNISAEQFARISSNKQLMAVVNQAGGFSSKFESRQKIEGKVFAIRTVMQNRETYGLMLVERQYGTTGPNGYLKIRLKVTGYDANGDGMPDSGVYDNMMY